MRAVARLAPILWRGTRDHDRTQTLLSVLAFAISAAFAISVLGGLHAFESRAAQPLPGIDPNDAQVYVLLAWVAIALLAVPIGQLGAGAARLGITRRNSRLAALRLIGATPGQVAALTLLETIGQAALGALAGLVGFAALLPIWLQLTFQGQRLTLAEMWPGLGTVALTMAGVVLLAGLSALGALRRVVVTPLGVAARHRSKGVSALRLVALVVALIVWAIVTGGAVRAGMAVIVVCLAGVMAAFNVVGVWLVAIVGRMCAAAARRPGTLLAARRLIEDPKGTWRIVGGPALACFVATMIGLVTQAGATGEGTIVLNDIRTGAWLTAGIAFTFAAAAAGISQIASVLDRSREYRLAHLAGVPQSVLDQGRRRALAAGLALSAGGASLTAIGVLLPFAGFELFTRASTLVAVMGLVVAGVALVLGTGELARPVLRSVLEHPVPRPD